MPIPVRHLPDAAYLRECFQYDAENGGLTWRFRSASHFSSLRARLNFISQFAMKPAGWLDRKGYVRVRLDGAVYGVHRLTWKVVHGTEPPTEIDHYDRNRSNNRIANLLPSTRLENCLNRGPRFNSVSGVPGVTWNRAAGRWRARFTSKGKTVELGHFVDLADAMVAHMVAVADEHGLFTAVPLEHRAEFSAFLQGLADRDVRHGKRDIPGFTITEERKVV